MILFTDLDGAKSVIFRLVSESQGCRRSKNAMIDLRRYSFGKILFTEGTIRMDLLPNASQSGCDDHGICKPKPPLALLSTIV